MLRVMARPRVAAISNAKTAVVGTITKTKRWHAPRVQHGFRPAVAAASLVNFFDQRPRSWISEAAVPGVDRRSCTARQSPEGGRLN